MGESSGSRSAGRFGIDDVMKNRACYHPPNKTSVPLTAVPLEKVHIPSWTLQISKPYLTSTLDAA